jgi:hypothetical protein
MRGEDHENSHVPLVSCAWLSIEIEEFCITVPEADQESITSVDSAVNYILASPHAK